MRFGNASQAARGGAARFEGLFAACDFPILPADGRLIPPNGISVRQTKNVPGRNIMQRRKFLRTAGLGAGGVVSVSALSAPAIAQSMPELKWRMASSFPKSLDTIYGAGEVFAKYIQEMTDNRFQVRVFASGEIVPGLQVLDAVQNGTVEMGHSAGTYYVGKDPTSAIDTALPFGTNARQQEAWMKWGGGRELIQDLYKDYNIYPLPCGNTGAQM